MKKSSNTTKNSTVKNFKAKKNLGGLVFDQSGLGFSSIEHWLDNGAPNGAYIYDTIHRLTVAGIPIVDATFVEGVFIRVPPGKVRPCSVNIKNTTPTSKPKIDHSFDHIKCANAKSHHTMNY